MGRLPCRRLVVWRNRTSLPKTGKEADINLLQKGSRNLRNANLVDIVDPVLGSANNRVLCAFALDGHKVSRRGAEDAEIRREPAAREHCPRFSPTRHFLPSTSGFFSASSSSFLTSAHSCRHAFCSASGSLTRAASSRRPERSGSLCQCESIFRRLARASGLPPVSCLFHKARSARSQDRAC